jgi:hypothetical protein
MRRSEQHLQEAAGEDQQRRVERFGRRMRLGRGDHEQDHARQSGAPGVRSEGDEQSAADAPDERCDREQQRVRAEHRADERREAGCDRGQQHALHAQAIRARLIEEHCIQRAGRDAEADADVIGRDADCERHDDCGGVAQRDAQRDVAGFQLQQCA